MSKSLNRSDILRAHEPDLTLPLPETPVSTPIQTSERPPASSAAANESPDDIAKRWSMRFKSVGGSRLSGGALGVSRSASACDLNLNPMPSQTIKVSLHLSVTVHDTNFGDSVILSGNNEALGMWMAEKSPPLSTSAEQFPVWSVDICMVLKMPLMPLEFKFAIIRNGSKFVDWERNIANRVLWPSSESISITCAVFNTPLPTWVKQTRPVIPDARTMRCKRPSDCQKLDWMCSCPCCNQTTFLDAEYGCNFASILIVYSNAHLAVKRDSMSEAELDEDVFSSVPEPVPTASRNSLILAAYASQAFDSSTKRFRPIGGKPLNNPLLDCHWRASSTVTKALAVCGSSLGEESMIVSMPSLNVSCDNSGKMRKSQGAFCKLFVARRDEISLESMQWKLRHQLALSSVIAGIDGPRPSEIVQVDVVDLISAIQNVGRDAPALVKSSSGDRVSTLPDAEMILGPRTGSLLLRDLSLSPFGKVSLKAQNLSNGGHMSVILDPMFVAMLRTPSGFQLLTSIRDELV